MTTRNADSVPLLWRRLILLALLSILAVILFYGRSIQGMIVEIPSLISSH